jgi:hypothetical protein
MPIEIRELHIKAVIDSGGGKPASEEVSQKDKPGGDQSAPNAEQIVDLCVEKVMEILKQKNER